MEYLLAVQTANSICIESKKKNMMSSETEAPNGRQSACIVSSVANLSGKKAKCLNRIFRNLGHSQLTLLGRDRLAGQQIVGALALALLFLLALLLLHVEAPEAAVHDQQHRDETGRDPGRIHHGVRGPLVLAGTLRLRLLRLLKEEVVLLLAASTESFRHCVPNRTERSRGQRVVRLSAEVINTGTYLQQN